ncbi:MAG: IS110 family transposase [Coriobacteriales bacterium]|jgi:transposase|nr:IS110 family transposase [Coriobacteriales bacterium]
MQRFDVVIGLDVGKSFHHVYALDKVGNELANRRINQHERSLIEAFTKMAERGSVLVVVDQPNNIGSLAISCARKSGCAVAYLPGLAMRRAAGILPGDAKTDERDAFVIAMTALSMPQALRVIPEENELRAELVALASCDNDARCDMTREINRLRAHLVEIHPAFEMALGSDVTSPFLLKLLQRFGGPWGMRKTGKSTVLRWARSQKHPAWGLLKRLLGSLSEMASAPAGAMLREEVCIPAAARRITELAATRKDIENRALILLKDYLPYKMLISMPGVGIKTAVAFIIHVDITCFDSADKLASYAGIAPRTHQSGTSIKGESVGRSGNKALKNALFLSAFASLRTDPLSREYYDQKRAEGKKHNAALICLARRRLKIMYAIVRNQKPYRIAG